MHETIWFDGYKYEEEYENCQMFLANNISGKLADAHCDESLVASKRSDRKDSLSDQISKAREAIQKSLTQSGVSGKAGSDGDSKKIKELEADNKKLTDLVNSLVKRIDGLESRVTKLEGGKSEKAPSGVKAPAAEDDDEVDLFGEDDDDDVDLFGSDEEEKETDEEARIKEERLKAYYEKKAKKTTVVAKSSVIFDVKPWDDETDLGEIEKCVRSIEMDGLLWGASKLVPVGYGINKFQIVSTIEDDKVSTEVLQELIQEFDDYVQSCDIAAFNKI